MSLRTVLVGVFALVFSLATAVGVFMIGSGKTEDPDQEMASVIVAKNDISRGQSLSADLLSVRSWPKDALPEGAITEVESAVERAALIPIAKGELLLELKLAAKGAGRGMAAIVPAGMRAVTIQTPNIATGVAGFILPGNKVDVLLTVSSQGANDPSGGATTFTLLQNVEILAVDQRIEAPQENKMDPSELRSITLMVTPADAARLDLGQSQGTLRLALRNAADKEMKFVEPATLLGLSGRAPTVAKALIEPPPPVREVIVTAPPPPAIVRRVRTMRGLQSGMVDFQPADDDENNLSAEELPRTEARTSRGMR